MNGKLSFSQLCCIFSRVCVVRQRRAHTEDSPPILHQEVWVKLLSSGRSLMSYSTRRPDSAVVVGNLPRKWHFVCTSLVDTHSLMCHGSGKSAFICVVAGRREDVATT